MRQHSVINLQMGTRELRLSRKAVLLFPMDHVFIDCKPTPHFTASSLLKIYRLLVVYIGCWLSIYVVGCRLMGIVEGRWHINTNRLSLFNSIPEIQFYDLSWMRSGRLLKAPLSITQKVRKFRTQVMFSAFDLFNNISKIITQQHVLDRVVTTLLQNYWVQMTIILQCKIIHTHPLHTIPRQ